MWLYTLYVIFKKKKWKCNFEVLSIIIEFHELILSASCKIYIHGFVRIFCHFQSAMLFWRCFLERLWLCPISTMLCVFVFSPFFFGFVLHRFQTSMLSLPLFPGNFFGSVLYCWQTNCYTFLFVRLTGA